MTECDINGPSAFGHCVGQILAPPPTVFEAAKLFSQSSPTLRQHLHPTSNILETLQGWIIANSQKYQNVEASVPYVCLEGLMWVEVALMHDLPRTHRYVPEYAFGYVDAVVRFCRQTVLALPVTASRNLNLQDEHISNSYEKILAVYKRTLETAEMHASKIKDSLDRERHSKTIEMAEISIKESKRVMLCEFATSKSHNLTILTANLSRSSDVFCVSIPTDLVSRNHIRHERAADQRNRP